MNYFFCIALILFFQVYSEPGISKVTKQLSVTPPFELFKNYSSQDYALNSIIEFNYFDLGELKCFQTDQPCPESIIQASTRWPKIFFASLKKNLEQQKVPVTLYSQKIMPQAKPFELAVRVKELELVDFENQTYVQLRVLFQVKDADSGQMVFKALDSAKTLKQPYGDMMAEVTLLADELNKKLAQQFLTYY